MANGATQRLITERYGTTKANLHNRLQKRGLTRGLRLKQYLIAVIAVFVPLCGWTV